MEVKTAWRMLRKATLRRAVNAAAVWLSFWVSRVARRPIHWGQPVALSFEPTTACNLGCPECPSGLRSFSRPTGMLQADLFRQVIDQQAATLSYLTFYFQGEPYLHPEFLDMVSHANRRNIFTATSTNAHYLSPEMAEKTVRSGLDRLIISIDGTTQEVYQQYRRRGSLEKVLEGTRHMVAAKQKLRSASPLLVFQFLVVRPNEHQIDDLYALAEKMGVDEVVLKTAQVYDYEQGHPLLPTQDQYSRYAQQEDGTYTVKSTLENQCWRMWHSCVVTWDGRVVPCCFDKDAHHQLGNVQEVSLRQVWKSTAYRDFRQALLRGRSQIDICRNCTEGTKVWA